MDDTSVYDAISQVTELEEKVYVELKVELTLLYTIQIFKNKQTSKQILTGSNFVSQEVNEFVKAMEQTSYNIKAELPDLLNHSRKIMGLYKP